MCLGASECLKCGRWLQPLPLTSNEVRQPAASLRSRVGPQKRSEQPNKSKWEGREPCLRGFAGHLGAVRSASPLALELPLCSQGRGAAVRHVFGTAWCRWTIFRCFKVMGR